MATLLDDFAARGLIADITDKELDAVLERQQSTLYVGFDPSAASLHVGSLMPIMAMARFQRAGHRVIALVGGATGMIGDPSGKSAERNLLTPDEVRSNADHIRQQLSLFLDFQGSNPAMMVDNNDWISRMSFIDWLREVGKYFSISYMLAKDSVKRRMESDAGISYTEFSYMTMQAYDFLYLCEHQKCILQMGGSDQWGNITAGIDLIRRVRGEKTYGLTLPLVTTSSGEKFGKSAGNAIWLDPTLTSPFRFYQYWLQVDDRDVDRFLKCFTFLAVSDIARIVDRHTLEPELRTGQRTLAVELTRCVHGADGLDRAVKATEILFGAEIQGLSEQELLDVFTDVPSACVPSDRLSGRLALVEVLVEARLFASKGEARRLIESGGLYVNNRRVSATDVQISQDLLAAGNISVIRKGKKDYTLLRFAD